MGRGVYCCECEEDAESEEKGVHLRGNAGFGKEPKGKKTLKTAVDSSWSGLNVGGLKPTYLKILTTHTALGAGYVAVM